MGPEDGQWTTVHYGRRRQRFPPRDQNWGGGSGRGKDSAPPGPFRARARSQFPNPRVPPFSSGRYLGPQSRSYAAVVRGAQPRGAPQPRFPRFGSNNRTRQQNPTDPKFGQLVRKMHAIIKVVHHLQNVASKPGKPEPRMISRMVDLLASMIKPASPKAETLELIRGNAKNWGYTTLLILEEHYTSGLEVMLEDLDKHLLTDWKSAFEVATRWAFRNLPRITQEVIDHTEALIASRIDQDIGSAAQADTHAVTQEEVPDNEQVTPRTRDAEQQTSPPPVTTSVQTHIQQQTFTSHAVSTMTEQVTVRAEPLSPSPREDSPLEARQQRRVRVPNNCVVMEDSGLLDIEEDRESQQRTEVRGPGTSPGSWLLDEDFGEQILQSPCLAPTRDLALPSRQDSSEVQVHAEVDAQTSQDDDLLVSTPKQQRCRVTRHINTDRKMIDWDLAVEKKWLIIGDSNLARFPTYTISDLQIESYPGANFRHAQALMVKSTSNVVVEKIVLSFGINCREQRAKETSVKQMQAAVKAAKKHFPSAEIWIPVINYSPHLPSGERTSLHMLNAHILKNMPFIPALRSTEFHTEKDRIHWTRDTAKRILDHWVSFLNLGAP